MQEQLKKLFTSMLILSGDSYFIDEDKLRQHARIVMEGLGAAVESLEDSIYLTNLLIAMGERHYGYRVKADMLVVRIVNNCQRFRWGFCIKIFCWCRGFCYRTESDLFLFLSHKPTYRHGRVPLRVQGQGRHACGTVFC